MRGRATLKFIEILVTIRESLTVYMQAGTGTGFNLVMFSKVGPGPVRVRSSKQTRVAKAKWRPSIFLRGDHEGITRVTSFSDGFLMVSSPVQVRRSYVLWSILQLDKYCLSDFVRRKS